MSACACGAPATHRLRYRVRSSRGVAERLEPPRCGRCANEAAWKILARRSEPVHFIEALAVTP